jgi:rod shape-determining protein MreC
MIILTVHFREGEDGPIHRAQRAVLAATSPLQAVVATTLSPVRDGWDYLIHFGELTRENRRLSAEVALLKGKVFELESLKQENARLRTLAGFEKEHKIKSIAAHVVGMPTSNWWSSVIVDRGSSDGVRRNMPVLAGGGLVGQVSDAASSVSKIILLNDVQSGVSVQDQRTGEIGVIKGQLKDKTLSIQYISRDSLIHKGDAIITSGLGGVFPKGIYVGRVSAVQESTYSLYKVVNVESPVDFTNMDEVLIIDKAANFFFKEGK